MLYAKPEPTPIQPLLSEMVKALVEYPEYADVHETETGSTVIYTIDVVPEDRGKVIGSGGRLIKSLQQLFHALGCKHGKQVRLVIYE